MALLAKRVLHFIDSGGVYGAERVILNLSQEMQRTPEFIPVVGCIVDTANDKNDLYNAAQAAGIEAIKIPIRNTRLLTDLPRAAKMLSEHKIDLIHSHGYKPSVFGFAIRLLRRIPVIATCHLWFEPEKAPLKMRTMIWLEKRFYRWFPQVIAVSEPIQTVLNNNGVPSSRTQIVKNGVDIPEVNLSDIEKAALRSELNIKAGTLCILNAGRLARQKAQWTLIETAALLKKECLAKSEQPDFKILIIGEGPLEGELRKLITLFQVEDCVSLLGFRSDINQLLAITDIFALPSLDEGMPMSLLEATAARVPVITTAVGDIPKLIIHEKTGLIVPVEDATSLATAINLLHNSPDLAKELAIAAQTQMQQHYSSQAMGQQYHHIYSQLLNP